MMQHSGSLERCNILGKGLLMPEFMGESECLSNDNSPGLWDNFFPDWISRIFPIFCLRNWFCQNSKGAAAPPPPSLKSGQEFFCDMLMHIKIFLYIFNRDMCSILLLKTWPEFAKGEKISGLMIGSLLSLSPTSDLFFGGGGRVVTEGWQNEGEGWQSE